MANAERQRDAQLEKAFTAGIVIFLAGLGVAVVVHPPTHTLTMQEVYGDYNPDAPAAPIDQSHLDWLLNTKAPPAAPSSGAATNVAPPASLPPGDHSHFNDNTNNALHDAGEVFKDQYGWYYYNQRYDAWYHVPLGNSKDIPIGSEGCLLADFAMIQSHLTGQKVTPLDLNIHHKEWFDSIKSPSHGAGIKTPFPTLAGHKPIDIHTNDFNVLHQKVKDGYALILELKYPIKGGFGYHYVVARGLDEQGHFLINDPWYGDNDNVPYGMHWSNANFDGNAWAYK